MAAVRFPTLLGAIKFKIKLNQVTYRIDLQKIFTFFTPTLTLFLPGFLLTFLITSPPFPSCILLLLLFLSYPILSYPYLFYPILSYLYLTHVFPIHPTLLLFYSHAFHYKSYTLVSFPQHFLHLFTFFATLACIFFLRSRSCHRSNF